MNSTTGLEPSSVLIRSTTSICTLPLQFAPLGKLREQTPLLSRTHGRPASDLLARAQTADAPAPRIERADVDARRWRAFLGLRGTPANALNYGRSEEHTSELQSPCNLVCRLLLEKKKNTNSSRRACYP